MHKSGVALFALTFACTATAQTESPARAEERPSRPITALVLSGGGARGAAHIGVLETLERLRVPVDLIVGTSMGAVVGGLYASGLSPEEVQDALLNVDWRGVFTDRPDRKRVPFRRKQDDGEPFFDFDMGIKKGLKFQSGLIAGQKLGFLLQTATLHTTGVESFDELPVPFRAVATDLQTGEVVVLDKGNLGNALRASMAVPSVFTPVEIEGRMLVDGGIVRNLPVDVARSLGAERIIAVDISTRLGELESQSIFSVASQSVAIYAEDNMREQLALLGPQDVLIKPDLGSITAASFEVPQLAAAIPRGAEAATEAEPSLRAFSVSEEEYAAYLTRQRRWAGSVGAQPKIDRIVVKGHGRVAPQQILSRMKTGPGDVLDLVRLQRDLERVYEIGEFQQAAFELERQDEQTILVIRLEEKYWGPNYLRLGLFLTSNFEGNGDYGLLGQITRTQINRYGAEWKNRVEIGSEDVVFSEFYQPLDYRGFFFVAPAFTYEKTEVNALSATNELERVRLEAHNGRFDVGVQFRTVGELRLGVQRGRGHVTLLTQSDLQPFGVDIGNWHTSLTIDRLDNANFPRHGSVFSLPLLFSRRSLGADTDYATLDSFVAGAKSFGKNTLFGFINVGSNLGSEIPFYERVELGGFLAVSGADPGTIRGNLGGTIVGTYYRQVALMAPALGRGIYLGGSLETGGAWDRSADARWSDTTLAGSLFVGADTRFGPLYLAYGRTEHGDDAWYFYLGRRFTQAN